MLGSCFPMLHWCCLSTVSFSLSGSKPKPVGESSSSGRDQEESATNDREPTGDPHMLWLPFPHQIPMISTIIVGVSTFNFEDKEELMECSRKGLYCFETPFWDHISDEAKHFVSSLYDR